MKLGIGFKIAALSIGLVMVTSLAAFMTSLSQSEHLLKKQELVGLEEDAWQDDSLLEYYLEILKGDVKYQTERRQMKYATGEETRTPGAKDSLETVLARNFNEFLRFKPQYLQMRLFRLINSGPTGWEIFIGAQRSDPPDSDEPRSIQHLPLLQKEDYVEQALKLKPGEVYFSKIEPVSEGAGAGNSPLVIRAAEKVLKKDKDKYQVFGVLVIDLDFTSLVTLLEKHKEMRKQRGNGREAGGNEAETLTKHKLITDDQGRILYSSVQGETEGLIQDQNRYPELAKVFQQDNEEWRAPIGTHNQPGDEGTFLRVKVPVDNISGNRFLGLAVVAPKKEFAGYANTFSQPILVTLAGGIVGAAAVAFLFAGILTRPLKKITRAARSLARGEFNGSLPVNDSGEIGVLARTFQDMAEQIRRRGEALEEREARIRMIVDGAAEGIITIDARGTIESFNKAAEKIFEYTVEEVRGQNVNTFMPLSRLKAIGGDMEAYLQSPEHKKVLGLVREVEGRRKDGTTFPMELSETEVTVGQHRLYTAIVRDITERKQAEMKIRQLNEHLERRVHERTSELQKTNEALEVARDQALEANQTKSTFLAQMSHELRTPLNAIIGYGELLQDEAIDRKQDDLIPDLKKITAAGKHLLGLINDVLDLSKVEAGRMELYLEKFEVRPVVQDVASTVEPLVRKNANTLELHCDDKAGVIQADRTRLRQVLFNLLSNACKFTDKGRIVLEVATESADGVDWTIFRVRDAGIGMTQDQLEKLFQPFTQVDSSTTRKYEGTGLGLTISRRFCQMMGGDISVASEFGQGTTFTVRLPTQGVKSAPVLVTGAGTPRNAAGGVEPGFPTDAGPGTSKKAAVVLVIDDDPAVHDMMKRILGKEGFRVVGALGGEEGMRLARELHPRVITLDVMMPEMDGWSVLSSLKADPALADIPVIMLTIVEEKNLGYTLGATDYLTKPLDRSRLANVLKKHSITASPGLALVVEDDAESRELLRRTLEKDGWEVSEAANGRQALDCVAWQRPALILLDLMMPEMDGFEFLTQLRQHPQWLSIPVVVVTAKDLSPEDRQFLNSSLLLGGCVRGVLSKGTFNRDDVLREVRDLVVARTGGEEPNSSDGPKQGADLTSEDFNLLEARIGV